jgi:hypothetical protein
VLRAWLLHIFRGIHRITRAVEASAPPLPPADEPF